jgi:hypothetical protein
MSELSRRQWIGSAVLTGAAAAMAGAAEAQPRASADDLVRAVKGARVFDLSFTWNDRAPVLGLNPPYAFALNPTRC